MSLFKDKKHRIQANFNDEDYNLICKVATKWNCSLTAVVTSLVQEAMELHETTPTKEMVAAISNYEKNRAEGIETGKSWEEIKAKWANSDAALKEAVEG